MAKGYLVANVEITDPERYGEYRAQVGAVVERYGGRFLIRGGTLDRVENADGIKRVVVLEFDSIDAARRFYHSEEYAPLLRLREQATSSQVVLVEGA